MSPKSIKSRTLGTFRNLRMSILEYVKQSDDKFEPREEDGCLFVRCTFPVCRRSAR